MKNIIIIFISFLSLTFSSCSSNNFYLNCSILCNSRCEVIIENTPTYNTTNITKTQNEMIDSLRRNVITKYSNSLNTYDMIEKIELCRY